MVILSFIPDKANEYDVAEPNRKNDYSIAMNANTHRQIVIPDWVDIDGALTNIKDYEFKDYELELYLITEDGNERRLAATEYSFRGYDDKNIRKLSDVLNFSFSGRIPMQYDLVSIDENYTELEIIINDDSYLFNLNSEYKLYNLIYN